MQPLIFDRKYQVRRLLEGSFHAKIKCEKTIYGSFFTHEICVCAYLTQTRYVQK